MWWTQPTNWSISPLRPSEGSSSSLMTAPRTTAAPSQSRSRRPSRGRAGVTASDAAGHPVALRGAVDVAQLGQHPSVAPHGVGHLLGAVEQPFDLALVDPDPGDLALELVGHVGIGREDADIGREALERVAPELVALRVVPVGVGKVLVEHDGPGVLRPGHHPLPRLAQEPDPGVAAELVVDMAPDPERHVHLLRLEPGDLAPEQRVRLEIIRPRRAEQLVVAGVAPEDRVR